MKQLLYYLFLPILFYSCSHVARETSVITDKCLEVPRYNKTLCLEEKVDTLYPILFIDGRVLESRRAKFSDLNVYEMIIVDIRGERISASNVNGSVSFKIKIKDSSGIHIQQKYYIITKEEYLSDSRIITRSDGTRSIIRSGSDRYSDDYIYDNTMEP